MQCTKRKLTQNTSDKLDIAMHEARNQMPWACENWALAWLEKCKKKKKGQEILIRWWPEETVFSTASYFSFQRKTCILDFGFKDLERTPAG